jgi:hypothetical protein
MVQGQLGADTLGVTLAIWKSRWPNWRHCSQREEVTLHPGAVPPGELHPDGARQCARRRDDRCRRWS